MLGIGRNRQHRLGGRPKQEIVDHRLVLIRDIADRRRQCEHDVEVRHGQKLRRSRRHPLTRRRALALRTVPFAAGNGRRPLPALWADPVMGSWRVDAGIFL
jgi:hypothetical protein